MPDPDKKAEDAKNLAEINNAAFGCIGALLMLAVIAGICLVAFAILKWAWHVVFK
jgi:hypothetical protein